MRWPICNGRPERAPHLFGRCFPLCWRCSAAAAGALVTVAAVSFIPLATVFHRWVWPMIGAAMLLPMVVDGALQYAAKLESTNARRIVTGGLFGIGIGLLSSLVEMWSRI